MGGIVLGSVVVLGWVMGCECVVEESGLVCEGIVEWCFVGGVWKP